MHFTERVSYIRRRTANISKPDGPIARQYRNDRNENQKPNEISQILVSFNWLHLRK